MRQPTIDTVTPCPKCAARMTPVAVTPHPVVSHMQRHTFVCYGCNQTCSYMLPNASGGASLAESA